MVGKVALFRLGAGAFLGVLLALGGWAGPTAAQSFNCRYAKTPDEMAICKSDELKRLDERMARAYFRYRNAMMEAMDTKGVQDLERGRKIFLENRRACGFDPDCIRDVYDLRIGILEGSLKMYLEDRERR